MTKAKKKKKTKKRKPVIDSKKPIKSVNNRPIKRNKKGQIVAGSGGISPGRPKLGNTKLDKLLQAVSLVETKLNKSLLGHFIERAFKSDNVLIALMKKMHPDLKSIEQLNVADDYMSEEEAEKIRKEMRKRFE